jgi:hypothetical protein
VLGQADINQAPAVDAQGQIIQSGASPDGLLVQGDDGLKVLTTSHVILFEQATSQHRGNSISLFPTMPHYGYVLSMARRVGSIGELEAQLERAVAAGVLKIKSRHAFHQLQNVQVSLGSLVFKDSSQSGMFVTHVGRANQEALLAHLRRGGVQV